MNTRNWISGAFAALFMMASANALQAQSYVRDGSIGRLAMRDTLAHLGDDGTPLETWVGKQFVILPKPKSLQRYGYSTLRRPDGGFIIPTYDECAGQVATVVAVEPSQRTDRKVFLHLDDGTEYTAVSATGFFPEIAALSDIDLARALWNGRTIWLYGGPVYEYDAITGKVYAFDVRGNEPVTVKEVVAGWDPNRPVRLIVETKDGGEGYIDIQVTSTNTMDSMWGRNRSSVFFADQNPRP